MSETLQRGRLGSYWPKIRGIIAYGAGPALGLASGPLLARAMGPDGRGEFASIMQPLTLAGALASIGIPAAATYFVAKGEYRDRSVLIRGMILSILFAAIAYGILVAYSSPVSNAQGINRTFLIVIWLLVFVLAAVQIQRGYLQGQARWRLLDFERFLFAILRFGGVAVLAFLGVSTAEDYVVASLSAFIFAGVLLWWPSRQSPVAQPHKKIPYPVLANYSLSAALGTIAVVANNRMDQILLPLMTQSREVGFYAVAVTVAEVPIILGTLASRDALYAASRGYSPQQVFRSSALYLGGAAALGVLLAIFAPLFMAPVFGDAFSEAVSSVQILCLGTIFACFALTLTAVIAGIGRPALSSVVPLVGLVVTGLLFWMFSQSMTSTIAAVVAAISQIVSVIVGLLVLVIISKFQNLRRSK